MFESSGAAQMALSRNSGAMPRFLAISGTVMPCSSWRVLRKDAGTLRGELMLVDGCVMTLIREGFSTYAASRYVSPPQQSTDLTTALRRLACRRSAEGS